MTESDKRYRFEIPPVMRSGEMSRREVLGLLGAGASVLASGASSASVLTETGVGLGKSVRLSRARLDDLAAEFFPAFNANGAVPVLSADRHAARFDINLYALETRTRMPDTGERVDVSGLLAVPVGGNGGALPVVSWQHGTILSFDQVPSNLVRLGDPAYKLTDAADSLETVFNLHRLAGQGFAVIAADYLGKGALRKGRGEAYAVRDATVTTCIDILNAGLAGLKQLGLSPSSLFLNGWSQGGLNTQWLHQELSRRGVKVTASATQSPFNNLVEALDYWTGRLPVSDKATYPSVPAWVSLCLIVVLGSYREYYGLQDLFSTAIKPEYRVFAEKFWQNYRLENGDLSNAPSSPSDLLVDGFFERFTSSTNSRFLANLGGNASTFHVYREPIRFYYGLADEALHPTLMHKVLATAGPESEAVAVPRASHRETFLSSLYGLGDDAGGRHDVVSWFRSFL